MTGSSLSCQDRSYTQETQIFFVSEVLVSVIESYVCQTPCYTWTKLHGAKEKYAIHFSHLYFVVWKIPIQNMFRNISSNWVMWHVWGAGKVHTGFW